MKFNRCGAIMLCIIFSVSSVFFFSGCGVITFEDRSVVYSNLLYPASNFQ